MALPVDNPGQLLPAISLLPSQLHLLIAVCVCLMLLLTIAGVSSVLRYRKTNKDYKRRMAGRWPADNSADVSERASTTKKQVFRFLTVLGESTKPRNEEELSIIRRTLVQAGYRGAEAPLIFFGIKLFLAGILPIGFAILRPPAMILLPAQYILFFFVFSAVAGFYLPNVWVQMKIRSRREQLLLGFPEALDLMVVCVEAGLGLDAAMQRVGTEMKLSNPVLSEEFKLLDLGLRAGQTRQQALRNLGLRTGLEDIENFTALLVQTDKFGTNIAQALRVHADSMRTTRRLRAEELAAKVPVKLLFPLVFFIFPSLFVVIMGPGIIQIARTLLPSLGGK
jgi:tight adherence protein C